MGKLSEDYFNERWLPYIKSTFEEVTEILRDKYVNGNADSTNIEMFTDSVWILAKCVERDWSIDFGFGKNKKQRKITPAMTCGGNYFIDTSTFFDETFNRGYTATC